MKSIFLHIYKIIIIEYEDATAGIGISVIIIIAVNDIINRIIIIAVDDIINKIIIAIVTVAAHIITLLTIVAALVKASITTRIPLCNSTDAFLQN